MHCDEASSPVTANRPASSVNDAEAMSDTSLSNVCRTRHALGSGRRSQRRRTVYALQHSFEWGKAEHQPSDCSSGSSRLRESSLSLSCPSLNLRRDTSSASPPIFGQTFLMVNSAIVRRKSGHIPRIIMANVIQPVLKRPVSPGNCIADRNRTSPVSSPQPCFQPKLNLYTDTRRWSVASLPSSGYDTPGSSNFSSRYSSQEKLTTAIQDLKMNSAGSNGGCSSLGEENSSSSVGPKSPGIRWRSKSFSGLLTIQSADADELIRSSSAMYKTRFPKAKKQMEEKLATFILGHSIESPSLVDEQLQEIASNGSGRFVLHQLVELASDCLCKSKEDLISATYFYEMTENLQNILAEVKEKADCCYPTLKEIATKLLIIISRPARLLECFEFDPKEFYQMMEEVEDYAKGCGQIKQCLPQYVLAKLGLRPAADSVTVEPTPDKGGVALLRFSGDFGPASQEATSDELLSTPSGVKEPPCRLPPPSKRAVLKQENFEEVKLISRGAYGAVVLVRAKKTRQRFALKKIRKSNLALRNQLQQVFTERDIMTFSDNPFVVSFYGSFETKTHLCMLMEYVEGGDCATLLKKITVMPLEMARLYIAETILAVEYLHSYGIVHRDLKPDNLLITAMGHVKLTDFGLSKIGLMNRTTIMCEGYIDVAETKQFQDRQICGTPEYIAPEVILRQGYGKPVDWWAVGVILFEFLIGTVPFFGETPEELFAHVISVDELQFPEEPFCPPPDAVDLIRSLLKINPLERLGTVGGGAVELKAHPFFAQLNWDNLLRQKAEFVPQLCDEEDTSYFDTRSDRYCHEVEDSADEEWSENSSIFSSFSSCSPRYSLLADSASNKESNCSSLALSCDDSDILTSKEAADSSGTVESRSLPPTKPEADASSNAILPKLSISFENEEEGVMTLKEELSPVDELNSAARHRRRAPAAPAASRVDGRQEQLISITPQAVLPDGVGSSLSLQDQLKEDGQRKQAALHLIIPPDASALSGGPASSSAPPTSALSVQSPGASSDDFSPRTFDPVEPTSTAVGKQPVVLQRGAKGFGFSIKSVRVYLGSSDFYIIQHIVSAVDGDSQAFQNGLRVDDVITHVNGASVQNLTQPELLQKLMCSGDWLTLRVTPLESSSIKVCPASGRHGRQSKRACFKQKLQRRALERRKRPPPLFRRLSGKRVSAELSGPNAAALVQSLHRSISSTEGLCVDVAPSSSSVPCVFSSSFHEGVQPAAQSSRSSSLLLPHPFDAPGGSMQPPSQHAASVVVVNAGRPSTLHGLKLTKTIKAANARRKEQQVMPLSPLARADHHAHQTPANHRSHATSAPLSSSPLTKELDHHQQHATVALMAGRMGGAKAQSFKKEKPS